MARPSRKLELSILRDRVEMIDVDDGRGVVFPFPLEENAGVAARAVPPGRLRQNEGGLTIYASAFLGVVDMFSCPVLLTAADVAVAGETPHTRLFKVKKVSLVRLSSAEPSDKDKAFAEVLLGILESGGLFFSYEIDAFMSCQQAAEQGPNADDYFWWSKNLVRGLPPPCTDMAVKLSYGFVGTSRMCTVEGREFFLTVVSRRARKRPGTRYLTRGADFHGEVANFAETEQIVWDPKQPEQFTSFRIIRGSIPIFWRQSNGIAKPEPELDLNTFSSRVAFTSHFKRLASTYGEVLAISLVNLHGSESRLAIGFEDHMSLDAGLCEPPPRLIAFDFHAKTKDGRYEQGLEELKDMLREDLRRQQVFSKAAGTRQVGVFRVNCVDCLDRTGVVQGMISRTMLVLQVYMVCGSAQTGLVEESEFAFKRIWADNADSISKQYSGTGALKTDFTRTGKRSTRGMLEDGVKSVMRIYFKNFVDGGRQDCLDALCGYGQALNLPVQRSNGHGFMKDVSRITPGGEKHSVLVELQNESLVVSNSQSILYEYPRIGLVSWERINSSGSPRLRLIYRTREDATPATTPLLLQFPSNGGGLREKFARSLISWSQPGVAPLFGATYRVRMMATSKDQLQLPDDLGETDVLCTALWKNKDVDSRLTPVPTGFEQHDFILVHSTSYISVLARKKVIPVISNVQEASNGQASALSLNISGVEVCFIFTKLAKPTDLPLALRGLKIGRSGYDISAQFDYIYIGGLVPGADWPDSAFRSMGNGYLSKTTRKGFFILRGCLADLPYTTDDKQEVSSTDEQTSVLFEENIQGRPAPSIPMQDVVRCTVRIRGLECEGVSHPPSVDSNVPLRTYVKIDSDYAKSPGRTRTVDRATSSPRWDMETLEVGLVESSRKEMDDCILLGQLVLSAPILGDSTCGYFSLRLSQKGKFETQILRASKGVGKIRGVLDTEFEAVDPALAGLPLSEGVTMSKRGNSSSKRVSNLFGKMSTYIAGQSSSDPFSRSVTRALSQPRTDSQLEEATQRLALEGPEKDDYPADLLGI
ncbi:hypothetical protein NDN08_002949 [Rhodosorus marinus]|uniref:SAC domain-containing protein n=1 Tax=Rhodosorus marinus TaxID=101924 RepID=A0AAV8UV50_9RHOD|nr:hypothetical protein NDN08_002949 [Rhodosorus marinus]